MLTLAAGASSPATASASFPTISDATHVYSIRACADKSSATDGGVIPESNEDDNCSAWTIVNVTCATGTWNNTTKKCETIVITPTCSTTTRYGCLPTPGTTSTDNRETTSGWTWTCNGSAGVQPVSCSELIPPPTNFTSSCPSPGTEAKLSWRLPDGYTLSYFRIRDNTTGADVSSAWIPENKTDPQSSTPSISIPTISRHDYTAWVHTRRSPTVGYSAPVYTGGGFVCGDKPSGTITAKSCTIPDNASTCSDTDVTWTTANRAPGAVIAVTKNNPDDPKTLSNLTSGTNEDFSVNRVTTSFFLYHNGEEPPLARATITADCAGTSDWIPNSSGTSGTCKGKVSVTASSGPNCTITPAGVTYYKYGTSPQYIVTPNDGYDIASILIGSEPIEPVPVSRAYTYTFGNIQTNRTISATCVKSGSVPIPPPTNLELSCIVNGGTATINASWTKPANYNTFYFRANPGTIIGNWPYAVMQDNVVGVTASFAAVPGQKYIVWVHTRDPVNPLLYSSEISETIICTQPGVVPFVTLTATPTTTAKPTTSTLTWTVSGAASSCTATGGTQAWSGLKSTNGGNLSISNITSRTTFYLQCENNAGAKSNIAEATVTPTVVSSPLGIVVNPDTYSVTLPASTTVPVTYILTNGTPYTTCTLLDYKNDPIITANPNTNTSNTTVNVPCNSPMYVTVPPAVGQYGYKIQATKAGEIKPSNKFTVTVNPASLLKTTVTITFNGNGATGGSTASQTVPVNTFATLRANGFTRTGYAFVSWNTFANGTGTDWIENYPVGTSDVTLYARWTMLGGAPTASCMVRVTTTWPNPDPYAEFTGSATGGTPPYRSYVWTIGDSTSYSSSNRFIKSGYTPTGNEKLVVVDDNDRRSESVTCRRPPDDLAVTSLVVNGPLTVGASHTFSAIVKNEGVQTYPQAFSNWFQVGRQGKAWEFTGIYGLSLPAGNSATINSSSLFKKSGDSKFVTSSGEWIPPEAGTYSLNFITNEGNSDGEFNTYNNKKYITFNVVAPSDLPDLTADAPPQNTATLDVSLPFSSIIRNTGKADAPANIQHALQYDEDTNHDNGNEKIATTGANPNIIIKLTGTAQVSFPYAFTSLGTKYVRVCADKNSSMNGAVPESNALGSGTGPGQGEGNNCSDWTAVTVSNLSVIATTPYNVAPDTNVSFTYTPTPNSGTQCRLLDYTGTDTGSHKLTDYQASSPIQYRVPNAISPVGGYGYYVQCRNTPNTAVSNPIVVNTTCAAGTAWNPTTSKCVADSTGTGTCSDGIKNGNETGIDTGGRCGVPGTGTCSDGKQNGNETGIDTGGRCDIGTGTCSDGIKNGNETGIDTGGRCEKVKISTPGACGQLRNSCAAGMFRDVADNSSFYRWACDGENNGSSASCSEAICSNGAVNPPACTVNDVGICLIGANNPPECTTTGDDGICPTGYTGTYPNCTGPSGGTCPTGYTGTYPNCVGPTTGPDGEGPAICINGAFNPRVCNIFKKIPIFIEG